MYLFVKALSVSNSSLVLNKQKWFVPAVWNLIGEGNMNKKVYVNVVLNDENLGTF